MSKIKYVPLLAIILVNESLGHCRIMDIIVIVNGLIFFSRLIVNISCFFKTFTDAFSSWHYVRIGLYAPERPTVKNTDFIVVVTPATFFLKLMKAKTF